MVSRNVNWSVLDETPPGKREDYRGAFINMAILHSIKQR
jgi:hypothetical protein